MGETKNTKLKSGFLTSEFWLTLGTGVTGVLVAIGVLSPNEADEFVKALMSVVGGLLTLGTMVAYIYGRIQLKRDMVNNSSQTIQLLEGIPDLTSSDPGQKYVE